MNIVTVDTPMTDHHSSSLPEWLTAHMDEVSLVTENQLGFDPDPRFPATSTARALRQHNLACLFKRILDVVSEGGILRDALENDHNGFTAGEVMRWVRGSPERLERYREAQKIGAEIIADDMVRIADGDGMEDVQRSKLKIDTRKAIIAVNNRERYGEKTTIDLNSTNVNIDIRALIEKRVNGEPPRLPVVIDHDA